MIYVFEDEQAAMAYVVKVNNVKGYPREGCITVTWATPEEGKDGKSEVPACEGILPDDSYLIKEQGA